MGPSSTVRQQLRNTRSRIQPCLTLAALTLFLLPLTSTAAPASKKSTPTPTARILVEPLGFVPTSRFFLPYRIPTATLDFLDADHLLFTFHVAQLMQREPDDPADDLDQSVRALVLHLPDGKVEAEGTWRLHDRERYLWMLSDGHFLMRQRDTLFMGDKTLTLSTYLHPEGTFVSGQLSPDTTTLVAQYAIPIPDTNDIDLQPAIIPSLGDDAPRPARKRVDYTLIVVDTAHRTANRVAHLPHAILLPMVQGGYLGMQQGSGKAEWLVDLNAFNGKSHQVADLQSACQPTLTSLSETAFLTESCIPYSSDHLVDAFDLSGHKLWEQTWQSRFTWGTIAYSATGNRFAYGSVEVNHPLADLDPVDEASIIGQPVGVFDTGSGKSGLVVDATPIMSAGENFALSPSGDSLAILRNGAIELYTLPTLTPSANPAQPSSPPAPFRDPHAQPTAPAASVPATSTTPASANPTTVAPANNTHD